MKKVWTSRPAVNHNIARAKDQNKRRLDFLRWRKHINRMINSAPKSKRKELREELKAKTGLVVVQSPTQLTFLKNPEGVSKFIGQLEHWFDLEKGVFVDLKNVKFVDHSAIVILLSVLVRFKSNRIPFGGSYPNDPEANELVRKSGFVDNLMATFKDKSRYLVHASQDLGIYTHAYKSVDSSLTAAIILKASEFIWDEPRRSQGVQRALVELMQNTHNHADRTEEGTRHWWLSVTNDEVNKKVVYSFVDFGIGIFENLGQKKPESRWFNVRKKLSTWLQSASNDALLLRILDGELHKTVTGQPHRGKGLPGIAGAVRNNWISNLCVISNDAYCDFSSSSTKKLSQPFSGTFVHWEVSKTNASCK